MPTQKDYKVLYEKYAELENLSVKLCYAHMHKNKTDIDNIMAELREILRIEWTPQ